MNIMIAGYVLLVIIGMTILISKIFHCSREIANHRAALDRCSTTQIPGASLPSFPSVVLRKRRESLGSRFMDFFGLVTCAIVHRRIGI